MEQLDEKFHENFCVLLLAGTVPVCDAARTLAQAEERLRLHLYDPVNHFAKVDHFSEMVDAEERFIDACREALGAFGGVEARRL